MRKDVEKMEMDDLHNLAKTGGRGVAERQTSKTTTPVRQESTATVASMASTGAPGTPGTPSIEHAAPHRQRLRGRRAGR